MAGSTPYYLPTDFQNWSVGVNGAVAIIEANTPGKTAFIIRKWQAWIDAQLRKRYAVPFNQGGATVPDVVLGWLTALVAPDVYRERGASPGQDDQIAELNRLSDVAKAEVALAANSKDGLFELPLNDGATPGAVVFASPLAYSETSPFVNTDIERGNGWAEDSNGVGTGDVIPSVNQTGNTDGQNPWGGP